MNSVSVFFVVILATIVWTPKPLCSILKTIVLFFLTRQQFKTSTPCLGYIIASPRVRMSGIPYYAILLLYTIAHIKVGNTTCVFPRLVGLEYSKSRIAIHILTAWGGAKWGVSWSDNSIRAFSKVWKTRAKSENYREKKTSMKWS